MEKAAQKLTELLRCCQCPRRGLAKEKVSYEQEADKQQEKIDNMKAAGEDQYVIKKQQEVLEENRRMIPDCERRLITAWDELSKLVDAEVELEETAEYQAAKEILEETRAVVRR